MTAQRCGILVRPAVNRVYAEASAELMAAELQVLDRAVWGGKLEAIGHEDIGGVPYLTFTPPGLSVPDIGFLANLSAAYALFAIRNDGLLQPVPLKPLDHFDDDLLTIPKYFGKTNELFTKLLLNVTVWSSDFAGDMTSRPLRVLDPLCGRGTTLNQALMYGYDADGMEIDGKSVDAYAAFLRTWLKRKRIKHSARVVRVRRDGRTLGRRLEATVGLTKEQYKSGDRRQLTVVHADTTRAAEFFRPGTYDVIVTDAPYGVQHGSRPPQGPLARSPLDLLAAALPGWIALLRPGGAIGVAWNTLVAPREEAAEVFAAHGLQVLDSGPYTRFRHRVDQAIVRDVLVARKPSR